MTGPAYARRNVERALAAGAEVRTGAAAISVQTGRIGVAGPGGVSEIAARRILLCLGARETPRSARLIGGTRPLGVLNTGALQSAVHLKRLRPFLRPLIVGTELVSLSSLLTCRHAGIRPVAVIEAAPHPVARWPLNLFPRLSGIKLHLRTELVAIEGQPRVAAAILRRDGVLSRIECDGVLLTGGFTPEAALARACGLAIDPGTGGPVTDAFGRCSTPGIFAAGNLLRPVETAGWCYREGRRIAGCIARDLFSGLPAAAIPVSVQAPLRYTMPQLLPAEPVRLQLRVASRARGAITAWQAGQRLATRHAGFRPERRILLDLHPRPEGPVEIRFEQDRA